jgi:WhiB family transcriptional regulator, redox-sensing transcriptional regulator
MSRTPASAEACHAGDWRYDANCLDEDPELFFPIGNTGPAVEQESQAKAVCQACPVAETCLEWAINTRQDDGVWGGLSGNERRTEIRRRLRVARAEGVA